MKTIVLWKVSSMGFMSVGWAFPGEWSLVFHPEESGLGFMVHGLDPKPKRPAAMRPHSMHPYIKPKAKGLMG